MAKALGICTEYFLVSLLLLRSIQQKSSMWSAFTKTARDGVRQPPIKLSLAPWRSLIACQCNRALTRNFMRPERCSPHLERETLNAIEDS